MITTLDPNAALVVIDLQKGITGRQTVHPVPGVIANAAVLAKAFRAIGRTVALVNVSAGAPGRTDSKMPPFTAPPEFAELVPELDRQPTDIVVTKLAWGAFTGTSLDLQLRRRGVTQIVLCGISTSIGVETTARTAFELGYHVTLAIDAMTDTVAENHAHAVDRIFPRLGECGTTADVLAMLGS
jgi:nicotinamidase-related amidase